MRPFKCDHCVPECEISSDFFFSLAYELAARWNSIRYYHCLQLRLRLSLHWTYFAAGHNKMAICASVCIRKWLKILTRFDGMRLTFPRQISFAQYPSIVDALTAWFQFRPYRLPAPRRVRQRKSIRKTIKMLLTGEIPIVQQLSMKRQTHF